MNPLVILTTVFAAAMAAPGNYAAQGVAVAHGPAVAAVAPVAAVGYAAPAPAIAVPAPYTTASQGPATTHVQQPAPVITKQLHYGKKQFVSGYSAGILKPAIPDFKIAVPTVLKGSVTHNAPIVKTAIETHTVNEPYPVERRVEVPYDAPYYTERINEVPVPVHVDRPYAVPHPVPVAGEPIVNVRRTAPVVQHTHQHVQAAPIVKHTVGHTQVAPAVAAYH